MTERSAGLALQYEDTRLPTLAWLQAMQGDVIDQQETADAMLERQNDFVLKALETLHALKKDVRASDESVNVMLAIFKTYVDELEDLNVFENPEGFEALQTEFYQEFHEKSDLCDEHKLGFEFLTGLVRFSIATRVTLQFAQYLQEERGVKAFDDLDLNEAVRKIREEGLFLERLKHCADISTPVIDRITQIFIDPNQAHGSYWEAAQEFFESHPDLDTLARSLVSIQYVPEDETFLGLAQFLHWNGFGGNGRFLAWTPIADLASQTIGYHGEAGSQTQNFGKRMQIFGNTIATVKGPAAQAATDLLYQRTQETGQALRIYDFCTGPTYGAVASIGQALMQKDVKVSYTLSDVDGQNLHALFNAQANPDYGIEAVHYVDLNAPLVTSDDQKDRYDLVSAAIGMHQLSSQGQQNALKHFTELAAMGGYISVPHVNENVHWQLMLITVNVTDREGYVPDEILHNFKGFAVAQEDGSFKVAYPLQHVSAAPNPAGGKKHLYDSTIYKVMVMSAEQLDHVQDLWNDGQYDQADRYVETEISGAVLRPDLLANDHS